MGVFREGDCGGVKGLVMLSVGIPCDTETLLNITGDGSVLVIFRNDRGKGSGLGTEGCCPVTHPANVCDMCVLQFRPTVCCSPYPILRRGTHLYNPLSATLLGT